MCLSIKQMACSNLEASELAPATGILTKVSMYIPVPGSTGYVRPFVSSGGMLMVLKSQQRLVHELCNNPRDPRKISLASW